MSSWRLIESGAADGHRNMALDEALLESCLEGAPGFPCLRLYAFDPPCLSLGANQPWEGSLNSGFCRRHGIEIVRRPTGGRSVLHHQELTYAVVARLDQPPFGSSVRCNYDAISRALVAAFGSLGVKSAVGAAGAPDGTPVMASACFAEPGDHEIASGAWKLAGSAQVRRRRAFLQHGSLPLAIDAGLLSGAVTPEGMGGGGPAPDLRGLAQVAGREISAEELASAIRTAFRDVLGARLEAGRVTPGEQLKAEQLRGHKYLTTAWTFRR